MRLHNIPSLLIISIVLFASGGFGQEQEFINVVKDFLQGDELKSFQNAYSSLPLEIRDKLTKDILTNPSKLAQDLSNMGPQVQNLIHNFASSFVKKASPPAAADNEIDVEMNMDYNREGQGNNKNKNQQPGFDFGPLGSMLGNLISTNPQMLMNMIQGFMQGNGGGFSFESVTSMLTQQFDLDTLMSMASLFTGGAGGGGGGGGGGARGDVDPNNKPSTGGFSELLQLQQITQMWSDFSKSPMGQKLTRVVPLILKADSLPSALRIIERETAFRFDVVLRQFQDPTIRKIFVAQLVKPIGQFIKGMKVPADFRKFMTRADEVLVSKMGLGSSMKEWVDPVLQYVRDTFKISKESLLDLSSEDIEKIASDILNKEVLLPLGDVYNAYEIARENTMCAKFIFCQLNRNFYNENFIRRHVIKTSSIISAFQASAVMKKDAFSGLYEAIHTGADGFDCTHGQSNFCLDLMHTTSHNEL